jgi:hypothetical protein
VNNAYNDMMVKSSVSVGQFFEFGSDSPVLVFLKFRNQRTLNSSSLNF